MTAISTGKPLRPLRLRRHEDRRLRAGHVWIFSNEVDVSVTPLRDFEAGEAVEVQDAGGRPLGTGYVNPHSLICGRVVSRDPRRPFGEGLIAERLATARALRERLFAEPFYRLVYGDSDGLPGLVVDRYGEVLVAQFTTAGMERRQGAVVAALEALLSPRGILLRNDSPVRELEGLERYVSVASGSVPERVVVSEGEGRFEVPLATGQKTGWFFDQRDNRERLRTLVSGARVLDLFSYVGAWGIQAALAGAREVVCVDDSPAATALAVENTRRNGVDGRVTVHQGEALATLREMHEVAERFDVIVLDPPAFVKRRKDLRQGIQAYRRLNEAALRLLGRDALLISCSCSSYVTRDDFLRQMLAAGRRLGGGLQIIHEGHQSADHPVHPAIPETAYLKALFARAVRGF